MMFGQQAPTIGGCPSFPANNIWNLAVDTLPVDPLSPSYVANIGATGGIQYSTTMPINIVPGTQPKVPIQIAYPPESDAGPYPIPPNAQVEPGNLHVLVVDKDNCILYETFNSVEQPDGSWNVDSAAKWDLQSNALRPADWTAADGSGLPITPGVLRYAEVAAGQINHALRFTAPQTRRLYLWPARHYASSSTAPALPPMGLRVRLRAGFDISGFSSNMQVVLRALQKYGMMLSDNGLAWALQADNDPRWNPSELLTLQQVVGANLEAVDVSGVTINADSGQAAQPGVGAALSSIALSQSSVLGGTNAMVTVTLSTGAPASGAAVTLTSSDPAFPATTVTVGAGITSQTFNVPTAVVTSAVSLTVTAAYNGSTASAALTVFPFLTATCPIFPANNIWNAPVDTQPVHPLSSAYVNNISATGGIRYDTTMPINVVTGNQPMVAINITDPSESDPGPYPIPPNAQVEQGSDLHVIVADKDNCILYETFDSVEQPDGSWDVDSAAEWNLQSNALRPAGWTSSDAAGLPILPGILRYAEMASGEIRHALRFTAPKTQRLYVWPARHYASSSTDPTLPPMGQRFRLKASTNISGFSTNMQVVLRALQKYGFMLADNGLPWELQADADPRWDPADLLTLRQVAGSNFEAVDVSGLMVDPDSGQAAGGAPAPASAVTVSHIGQFTQGQNGVTYTIAVSNTGTAAAVGTVSVADTVPAGLAATGIGGTGWTCTQPAGPCTRSDYLAAGAGYPALTLTANVLAGAPSQVVNQVNVTGGALPNAVATDTTTILPPYTDVSPSYAFFDAINLIRELSITSGCLASPPEYCPNDNITRGQMAVFVVRSVMGGDNFSYTTAPYFTDVPATYAYFKWVQKMQDLGITLPCGTSQYCPDLPVTRGVMAVLIIRARYGVPSVANYPATPYFTDVGTDNPYFSWIQKMKQLGITSGCTVTTYCPDDPVTRGQMAVFIMRGTFNQLLPSNTPYISSLSVGTGSAGQSVGVTMTFVNTNLASGVMQVNPGPDISVTTYSISSPTTITAVFAVAANAASGPRSITVITGSGDEATLPNGFVVQ